MGYRCRDSLTDEETHTHARSRALTHTHAHIHTNISIRGLRAHTHTQYTLLFLSSGPPVRLASNIIKWIQLI